MEWQCHLGLFLRVLVQIRSYRTGDENLQHRRAHRRDLGPASSSPSSEYFRRSLQTSAPAFWVQKLSELKNDLYNFSIGIEPPRLLGNLQLARSKGFSTGRAYQGNATKRREQTKVEGAHASVRVLY